MAKKVIVAMSGGVDSSSVARKMIDEGYQVIGTTLDFGKFCGGETAAKAKKIADELNIEHFTIECEEDFEKKIIKYFASEYVIGNTPNPCVKCNRYIKFALLLDFMKKQNADFLATGHYAKIENIDNNYRLTEAKDKTKDQSYFLSQLKYEYLQHIKFPLGDMIKAKDVRDYANDKKISVANSRESQDICFTANRNYKDIIKDYFTISEGNIVHTNGKILGKHSGIINYTRGQRKGLGIGYGKPLFVIDIDAKNNIVYVGSEEELMNDKLKIYGVNLLYRNIDFGREYIFNVKVRYSQNLEKAKIIFNQDETADIELFKKSRNIARGQLCCIYDNEYVVGSGFIL